MDFGISVTNPRGSVMFNDREMSFLYLGKVRFTYNAGSSTIIKPFNIPSNMPFMAFVHGLGNGSSTAAHGPILTVRDGYIAFTEATETQTSYSCDIYLFVPAKAIPTPSWGIAVYKQNGQVTYHSGRPLLQIDSFASISVTGGGRGTAAVSTHTASKKVANAITFLGLSYDYGSPWAEEHYHTAIAYRNASGAYVVGKSVKVWELPGEDWYWAPEVPTKSYSIPLIDCAFYDRFSNYGGALV